MPDSILLRPAKLSASEWEIVREHAAAGARILSESRSELLQLAEEIAASHDECWDGSGYPLGLVGEAIPLGGRILAVGDVFDALTHDRPYKQAWTVPDAVDEMRRLSGIRFDPPSSTRSTNSTPASWPDGRRSRRQGSCR